MIRALIAMLLCLTPALAGQESNFGRVILSQSDLIVLGVASATRTNVGGSVRVELTLERVLHGKDPGRAVAVVLTDPGVLQKDTAVRGLFALKSRPGGHALVGKPVMIPGGDKEQDDKLEVARAFIALETEPEGEERTSNFLALLHAHLRRGGYAAQNAAVELMFVARDRAEIVTLERFKELRTVIEESAAAHTSAVRADLKLALQGMVEARIKDLNLKTVRRAEKPADRKEAVQALAALHKEFPRAFTEADSRLCETLAGAERDRSTATALTDLARAILISDREHRAERERKSAQEHDRRE